MAAEPPKRAVLVALGGNVGDVPAAFRRALEAMPGLGLEPRCLSRLYRTRAELFAGAPPQEDYGNAAVLAVTQLLPTAVLAGLHALERAAGPRSRARWAPRRLDLDYLDDEIFVHAGAALALPHPRAHLRRFVLEPLVDVAPDWCLGGQRSSVARLLAGMDPAADAIVESRLSWLPTSDSGTSC